MTQPTSSNYIETERRDYSLYVMRYRAIPAATDGLKAAGRRALWTGRDGAKYKTATLAGATMPMHPHDDCAGSINTVAAPYGNNFPLFTGKGAFGTLINPKAYGASRYTAVSTSKFTNDVVFRDIEVIPMTDNYDGTLEEPVHFLPLVPVALLNPAEGVAVGFATNILPRDLADVINGQIAHLKGSKKIDIPVPTFYPLHTKAYHSETMDTGRIAYYFNGELERKDTTTIRISKLPYGQTHTNVVNKLEGLLESGTILDYTDNSKNIVVIDVKFKRGFLKDTSDADLYKMLGLSIRHIENLNVLDFSGRAVWSTTPVELIQKYTDWRLTWYVNRYQRLHDLLQKDIQRYLDIRTAIKNNVSAVARKTQSRAELREFLTEINIVNTDYIADLPVYRFTQDEYDKNEQRIAEAMAQLEEYKSLLASEDKRKKIYITELQEVLGKHNKGEYA